MEQYAINLRIGDDLFPISGLGEKIRKTPISADLSSWSVMVREGKEKLMMEIVLPTDRDLKDSLRQVTGSADYEKKRTEKTSGGNPKSLSALLEICNP